MSDLAELERRLEFLEDIEGIKRLKAKYWNSIDNKDWEALTECYTEDVIFDDAHFGRMEGRDYIVKVLKRAMKDVSTAHHGHNPEIQILSSTAARGRWALNDWVKIKDQDFMKGCAIYEDEYVKANGSWKIQKSKLTYFFQET
jgi:ketosteroid isomerase-like protein